jgi:hypothetical protein
MAKSQSQNRLVLVSPDTLMSKSGGSGHQLDQATEPGSSQQQQQTSFYRDPVQSTHPTDLLYKQHMQYTQGRWNQTGAKSW